MENLASIKEYGGVLIIALALCLQYFVIIQTSVGKARRKHFTQAFMDKNFAPQHKRVFGCEMAKGGYPDHGSGRYSQKLTYRAWIELNNAIRVHYNYLEILSSVLFGVLVAGIVYPYVAMVEGFVYFIARILYSSGYLSERGASGRKIGAILGFSTWFAIYVTAVLSGLKFVKLP